MSKSSKEEKKHELFSASSAERWIACPPSIRLSKGMPREESIYAKTGTDAHTCLETILKNGPEKRLASQAFLRKTYPEEMVVHAGIAADEIWKLAPKGAEIISESKSKLDHIHESMGGTSDVVIAEDFGTLYIVDFKYGTHAVEVVMNPQLLTYALAEAHKRNFDFENILLVVIQPRAHHRMGPVRKWECSVADLREWEKTLRLAAKLAFRKDAEFKSGRHCYFCPAKAICPKLSEQAIQDAKLQFKDVKTGDVQFPPMRKLPEGRDLGKLLEALAKVDIWAAAVRGHAERQLNEGKRIPGWKLVDKRATRRWRDAVKAREEAVELWGEDALTEPELLTPAQLEAENFGSRSANKKKREWIERNSISVSSGTKIAPEDDTDAELQQLLLDFQPPPKEGKKK